MTNEDYQAKLDAITKIDIQNEKMAIGHMLQNEEAAVLGEKILDEKHFVIPYNAYVFKTIKYYIAKGDPVNKAYYVVTSIADEDWRNLMPECSVTRQQYIGDCLMLAMNFLINISLTETLFSKIKEQYLRRKMLEEYRNGITGILNTANYSDLKDLLNTTVDKIESTIDQVSDDSEIKEFKSIARSVLEQKQTKKINTGFDALDEILDGFRTSQLVVIGAATSIGKSAFAVNLALNICDQEQKIALWSFEMDEEEIIHRIFAIRTGFSSTALKNNNVSEEHYNALRNYIENTKDDIKVFTSQITNLNNFYLQCRRLKISQGVKVVIIDYLQLIHLNQNYENNRVRELEMITNTLKNIAAELDIVIIALSQLSREVNRRSDKTPVLSDLRDSGSIEQDANVVIFLSRNKDQQFHSSEKMMDITVAKNRSGKTGTCRLRYNGSLTKFYN